MPRFSALSLCLLLTGCSALEAAAPIALSATEALIRSRLQQAPAAQALDLAAALALLEECRAAKVAAEAAAKRAEDAALEAASSSTVAQAHSRSAEASARAAKLEIALAQALVRSMAEAHPASSPSPLSPPPP